MAVAPRDPVRVVPAARTARRGDVLFHDRGHHPQPNPDRQGQQPSRVWLASSVNATLTVSGAAG
jgi:hypothetical protein